LTIDDRYRISLFRTQLMSPRAFGQITWSACADRQHHESGDGDSSNACLLYKRLHQGCGTGECTDAPASAAALAKKG
jgi:hypothetical protein